MYVAGGELAQSSLCKYCMATPEVRKGFTGLEYYCYTGWSSAYNFVEFDHLYTLYVHVLYLLPCNFRNYFVHMQVGKYSTIDGRLKQILVLVHLRFDSLYGMVYK